MTPSIAAAILAGGEGRRLGKINKAAISLGGRTLFDLVLERLKPQANPIALSARKTQGWGEEMGLPFLEDRPNPECGPLGGVAAALDWALGLTPVPDWLITVPVDTPFLPSDLCARLIKTDADIAVAQSGGRTHHTVAAWRPALMHCLLDFLSAGAQPVHAFQETMGCGYISWTTDNGDPFLNINTPDDIALAIQRTTS